MAAMALAAEQGGALALRANGPADIGAIRAISRLPIIGILKRWDDRFPVYITPDFASAVAIAEAGADIIALDATARLRDGEPLDRLIGRIPVSYTHLDVYKRQGLVWRARSRCRSGHSHEPMPSRNVLARISGGRLDKPNFHAAINSSIYP